MKKKNDLIWGFSLIIIGAATIILAGSNVIGVELPDIAVRIIKYCGFDRSSCFGLYYR